MVGGDVQVERLTTASAETKKRLDVEVIQPIKQWMVAYRTIAVSSARAAAAIAWESKHQCSWSWLLQDLLVALTGLRVWMSTAHASY
jgi:hypothetical protein